MLRPPTHPGSRQHGAVLIIALVLLLVLTMLGTAGMRDTAMEERMAGNFRDHAAAFAAAETALRVGERSLSVASTFNAMLFNGTDGTYEVTPASVSVDPVAGGYLLGVADSIIERSTTKVSALPEYYIEKVSVEMPNSDLTEGLPRDEVSYYRVTGRGYGTSPNTEVILQSTYLR